MEYMNNASNSYGAGDAVSSSLANMTINDQHHQENGVAKMKGQRIKPDTERALRRCWERNRARIALAHSSAQITVEKWGNVWVI